MPNTSDFEIVTAFALWWEEYGLDNAHEEPIARKAFRAGWRTAAMIYREHSDAIQQSHLNDHHRGGSLV